MAATIKIKNSSTTGAVPTASDLVQGELAVNVTDTGLYTENASGTVVKLNAPSIDDKNTGATKHVTIASGGSVGLGATSPAAKLHVKPANSDTVAELLRLEQYNAAGTDRAYLAVTADAANNLVTLDSTGTNTGGFVFKGGGTERARIDTSGNVYAVSSTGALGYGAGAGGTVTQTTSRTTGVTINKPTGAITLVSAAGSTTIQSFTVTNSIVAASDTVIVSQKSGTDLYRIYVTNVAAGSFKISFATLSGTTTEQPVFNFAVIRATTA